MSLYQKAKALHQQGLSVTPTNSHKAPIEQNWQHHKGDNRRPPNGNFDQNASGIGLVCGHPFNGGYFCGLDADCYDKYVSRDLCDFIFTMLGHPTPIRVGTKPKFLLPFTHQQQIRKLTSASWQHPGDAKPSRIEVLGDGQQFVAFGQAGGKEYRWYNGEFDPNTVVTLTDEQLQAIFDEFDRLCQQAGMVRVGSSDEPQDPDDFIRTSPKPPLDLSIEQVRNVLRRYKAANCDYERWVEVGMALAHQSQGQKWGFDTWMKWSAANSTKHDPRHMPKKWQSFLDGQSHGTKTFATIIKRAKDYSEALKDAKTEARKGQLRFLPQSALVMTSEDLRPPEWLIKSVITKDTTVIGYGPSNIGKTFAVMDMMLCIASGRDFHGYKTYEPQKVVYMAGEGAGGILARIYAWCLYHGLSEDEMKEVYANLKVSNAIVQLAELDDPDEVIEELRSSGFDSPALFVIDTLSRAATGLEENSNSDMAIAVRRCDYIREQLNGASVMIVHHSGKNAEQGSRGAYSLYANPDGEIRFDAIEGVDGGLMMSSTKMKDSERFNPVPLKLQQINLGKTDRDGDEMTSVVTVTLDQSDTTQADIAKVGEKGGRPATIAAQNAAKMIECIKSLVTRGVTVTGTHPDLAAEMGMDAPTLGVTEKELRREYCSREPGFDDMSDKEKDKLRKQMAAAITKLGLQGVVRKMDDGVVYILANWIN